MRQETGLGQLEGEVARGARDQRLQHHVATVNAPARNPPIGAFESIFGMGSGERKEPLPSNIAGLPPGTPSAPARRLRGAQARRRGAGGAESDTAARCAGPATGGVASTRELDSAVSWRCVSIRFPSTDYVVLCAEPKLRKLVKNMVYVGVAASCSRSIWRGRELLRKQFAKKVKVFELNFSAVKRLRLCCQN